MIYNILEIMVHIYIYKYVCIYVSMYAYIESQLGVFKKDINELYNKILILQEHILHPSKNHIDIYILFYINI